MKIRWTEEAPTDLPFLVCRDVCCFSGGHREDQLTARPGWAIPVSGVSEDGKGTFTISLPENSDTTHADYIPAVRGEFFTVEED